ncbi:serine/arginine repetitive matrix protein 1 isoform X1 [Hordeum vulgare subsp. vulgare]|uniref:Uncharacterized protein n=1 Tax=Hordeum vulgare subsp. vulgare TaxID=112509 RepID=A0A8I6XNZ0_HORVV|nr:serine/arginine repetitive matrix protein 1 isoform X1 [Hordeum vulgare subsp. vulgare]
MESMEPMDIDWNRVVSRFVRDDTYEGIEAPHWADLADPEAGNAAVDDDAWFCRPDCKHPKTADDFLRQTPSPKARLLRSMSAMMPFGERDANNNLKRRGAGGTAAFASPTKPKPPPKKRFQDDAENQDPALTTPPPAATRPPFGAQRWAKNAKEAIKSSAEKRPDNAEKEALLGRNPAPRQLKSTLSARNLFSGKDILGQISDFYNELKRMAGGGGSQQPVSEDMEEMSPINSSVVVEKVDCSSGGGARVLPDAVKKVARQETAQKSPSPMKGKKAGLKVEAGRQRSPSVLKEVKGQRSPSVLKEVKATPPTPQRFPSPSVNRVKSVKAAGATSSSPLKKTLKDKMTPNKDQENSREAKRQPFGVKDMNNNRAYEAEESSSGVFWFLKPCTFLVE